MTPEQDTGDLTPECLAVCLTIVTDTSQPRDKKKSKYNKCFQAHYDTIWILALSCLLLVISSKPQFASKALILSRMITREYTHCSVTDITLVTNQRPASVSCSQSEASDVTLTRSG